MIKNLFKTLIYIIFSLTLYGQTSGKISGRIIEKESGEPLVGANIIIQTQAGTSADEEGYFNLINVSPGKYSVRGNDDWIRIDYD